MPPITALDLITVTGTFKNLSGDPAVGIITFTPSITMLRDSADNIIVLGTPLQGTLDGTGHVSIDIPATNDPDYQPIGWTYKVTQAFLGLNKVEYSIQVPFDAVGQTIDLADIAPVAQNQGTLYAVGRVVNTDGGSAPTFFVGDTEPVGPTPGDVWISSSGVQIWEA